MTGPRLGVGARTIDLDMIDAYLSEMIGFFDEIARPGWTGPSQWQSKSAELTIEGHDREDTHVALHVRLWWSRGDELDSERHGQLIVRRDALPRFARQLRELTRRTGRTA